MGGPGAGFLTRSLSQRLTGAAVSSEGLTGAGRSTSMGAHSHDWEVGDGFGGGLSSSPLGPNITFFIQPQPTIPNPFLQYTY